jgi:hypothetical protein
MENEQVVHGNQESIHASQTLCGKDLFHLPRGESSIEIPGDGIAEPNWITCKGCRERLNIKWD